MKMKKKIALMLTVIMCLAAFLTGCDTSADGNGASKGTIIVSSPSDTEKQITAILYALALEDAGYEVEWEMGSDMAFDALLSDDVDLTPDYVGTAYTRYMVNDPIYDAEEMENIVREYYAENYNVALLEPTTVDSNYAIVMMRDKAEEMGIENFQDLQQHAEEIVFGDWGFLAMPTTGRSRIEELFGPFNFKEVMDISMATGYDLLANGDVDAIIALTTDAQLSDEKFIALDQGTEVWCRYYLAPFIRQEILDEYPEVEDIINVVSASLDTDTIIDLNHKCNIEMEEVEDVAREYYNNK